MIIIFIIIISLCFGMSTLHEYARLRLSEKSNQLTLIFNVIVLYGVVLSVVLFIPAILLTFLNFSFIGILLFGIILIFYPLYEFTFKRADDERETIKNIFLKTNIFLFALLSILFTIMTVIQSLFYYQFLSACLFLIISIALFLYYRTENLKRLKILLIILFVFMALSLPFHIIVYSAQGFGDAANILNTIFMAILGDPIIALTSVLIVIGALARVQEGSAFKFIGNGLMIFTPLLFWMMIFLGALEVPPQLIGVFLDVELIAWVIYSVISGVVFVMMLSMAALITNVVIG